MLVSIINLYVSWYTGKQTYTEFEGKTLIFAIRRFSDAISSIAALIIVPQDKLLEDFFDMKSWFMKIKKCIFCRGIVFLHLKYSVYYFIQRR